jgi:hypothetical protein
MRAASMQRSSFWVPSSANLPTRARRAATASLAEGVSLAEHGGDPDGVKRRQRSSSDLREPALARPANH